MCRMGRALKEILLYFGWTRVALFYTDDKTTRKCYSVAQGAMKIFPRHGIHIVLMHEIDGERPTDEEVDRFLDAFPDLTRSDYIYSKLVAPRTRFNSLVCCSCNHLHRQRRRQ